MTPAQRKALKAVAEGPHPSLTSEIAHRLYGEPLTQQRYSAAFHLLTTLQHHSFLLYNDGWKTTAEGDRVLHQARPSPRLRWRRAGLHRRVSAHATNEYQLWLDRKFLVALVFDVGHEAFVWRAYYPSNTSLPSATTPRHKEGEERSLTAAREVASAAVLAFLKRSDPSFKRLPPREAAKTPSPPRRP
jgi:hypothetical protein